MENKTICLAGCFVFPVLVELICSRAQLSRSLKAVTVPVAMGRLLFSIFGGKGLFSSHVILELSYSVSHLTVQAQAHARSRTRSSCLSLLSRTASCFTANISAVTGGGLSNLWRCFGARAERRTVRSHLLPKTTSKAMALSVLLITMKCTRVGLEVSPPFSACSFSLIITCC